MPLTRVLTPERGEFEFSLVCWAISRTTRDILWDDPFKERKKDRERNIYANIAKIYSKKESFICEIMKKKGILSASLSHLNLWKLWLQGVLSDMCVKTTKLRTVWGLGIHGLLESPWKRENNVLKCFFFLPCFVLGLCNTNRFKSNYKTTREKSEET